MMRYMAGILLVLVMVFTVGAQSGQDDGDGTPERAIYDLLVTGDRIFEVEMWDIAATDTRSRSAVTWTSADLGAVARLEHLVFPDGITDEALEPFLDFDFILSNYDAYILNITCREGDLDLYEFDVDDEGGKYVVRYWVTEESDTEASIMFMAFPTSEQAELDRYAVRYNERTWRCKQ
ncbi:MAG: hypothetical protein OHK0046_11550 [Anaerolineae bacterium]